MSLRERVVLLLELREEAHVLNRDDRLVGEGLQQLDLLRAERSGLSSANVDGPDRLSVAEHGHCQ
ncbi:MAG TPA: hypothetical protein VFP98_00920, partial [Candidatus Polarisedimenticolia bacterium]|nr:hypothetical protein [Candidatus Polarisedimenticolia bacterium]